MLDQMLVATVDIATRWAARAARWYASNLVDTVRAEEAEHLETLQVIFRKLSDELAALRQEHEELRTRFQILELRREAA